MKAPLSLMLLMLVVNAGSTFASETHHTATVSDAMLAKQRAALAASSEGQGFGPQAPRDIDRLQGVNPVQFSLAPEYNQMNLCNIHFHKNAEHKGGEFTEYAGNGDGHGYNSGYTYAGKLNKKALKKPAQKICPSEHGDLSPGDTIEVHYVFSSAQINPGPTLNSCFNATTVNPQLRVETQVFVLVNDKAALDFTKLTAVAQQNGFYQPATIPANTGTPVVYRGSTTGPGYNEVASPYQVTWSVRPKLAQLNIETVGTWCQGNVFEEDHAHGVRNLVVNPTLLSGDE